MDRISKCNTSHTWDIVDVVTLLFESITGLRFIYTTLRYAMKIRFFCFVADFVITFHSLLYLDDLGKCLLGLQSLSLLAWRHGAGEGSLLTACLGEVGSWSGWHSLEVCWSLLPVPVAGLGFSSW
jgi:hypothetical protein